MLRPAPVYKKDCCGRRRLVDESFGSGLGGIETRRVRGNEFKMAIVGASSVGKTSLVTRLVQGTFEQHPQPTVGAAFMQMTMDIDGQAVKVNIWDTAGQEKYHSLAPISYRNAALVVIVYDVTDSGSFHQAQKWVAEVKQALENDKTVFGLVGNKLDLSERRQVGIEKARMYASSEGLMFGEASAKSGGNVTELFDSFAQKVDLWTTRDEIITMSLPPPARLVIRQFRERQERREREERERRKPTEASLGEERTDETQWTPVEQELEPEEERRGLEVDIDVHDKESKKTSD